MADEQVTNAPEATEEIAQTPPEETTPAASLEETSSPAPVEAPAAVAASPVSAPEKPQAPKGLPGTLTSAPEGGDKIDFGAERNDPRARRRTRVGRVVSSKMEKTIIVSCEVRVRHPLYGKFMKRTTKFKAHDENNVCGEGDTVEIMETRPISKDKNWRLIKIVEKAK